MYEITFAIPSDLEQVHQLEERCFESDRLSLNDYKSFHSQPDAVIIVVKDANDIVGSAIVVIRKQKKTARLYSIAVDPNYRRTGIAKKLFEFIENYAIGHHCEFIVLEVRQDNAIAINFYQKKGFETIAEYQKYYDDGMDAFRMRKKLDLARHD